MATTSYKQPKPVPTPVVGQNEPINLMPGKTVKTGGVKIRGTGAATKATKATGPMA